MKDNDERPLPGISTGGGWWYRPPTSPALPPMIPRNHHSRLGIDGDRIFVGTVGAGRSALLARGAQ